MSEHIYLVADGRFYSLADARTYAKQQKVDKISHIEILYYPGTMEVVDEFYSTIQLN